MKFQNLICTCIISMTLLISTNSIEAWEYDEDGMPILELAYSLAFEQECLHRICNCPGLDGFYCEFGETCRRNDTGSYCELPPVFDINSNQPDQKLKQKTRNLMTEKSSSQSGSSSLIKV